MNLPDWTPRFLARALGHGRATEDRTALAAALTAAHDRAWTTQPAEARTMQRALTGPLNFQAALLDLHRDQAAVTAYLNSLAGASETNLNLADPDQRALYQALIDAARQAEQLEQRIRHAATSTLAAPATADCPAN
ncbi:hypothetical protein [Kitasatospora sp. NPDC088548]|uniref:hypothetical protein n=1 Tax=Kitasatospora sp. NPDC088548 TaxID=3364075 RepID=UPI003822E190